MTAIRDRLKAVSELLQHAISIKPLEDDPEIF